MRAWNHRSLAIAAACALSSVAAVVGLPAEGPAAKGKPTAVSRGAELFARSGCVHCHGAAGIGGGIGPDLSEVRRRLSAAQMVAQVTHGGGAMPAFGEVLNGEQIGDLVTYLRSKRTAPAAPTPGAEPAPTPAPAEPPSTVPGGPSLPQPR